jgi:hypothetical protein
MVEHGAAGMDRIVGLPERKTTVTSYDKEAGKKS